MNLTGPLGKQYCAVFQYMSLFSLFFAIMSVVVVIYTLMTSKYDSKTLLVMAYIPIYLLAYIQNRLLYNICLHQ